MSYVAYSIVFFFFKQKTAYEMRISDWSSDVCSSDLRQQAAQVEGGDRPAAAAGGRELGDDGADHRHELEAVAGEAEGVQHARRRRRRSDDGRDRKSVV